MKKHKLPVSVIRFITNPIIALSGLILLIMPKTSLVTVCFILGITVLIKGITRITNGSVASGIAAVILSVILFLHPKILLSVFPFIIGLVVLAYALHSLKKKKTLLSKISAVLMFIAGITIIVAPFKFAAAVTSITGAVLLVLGLVLIISQITAKKQKKDEKDIVETEIIDVEDAPEIIDVTDFKDVD